MQLRRPTLSQVAWLPWRIGTRILWFFRLVIRLSIIAIGWILLIGLLGLLGRCVWDRYVAPEKPASSSRSVSSRELSHPPQVEPLSPERPATNRSGPTDAPLFSPDGAVEHDGDPSLRPRDQPKIGTPPKRRRNQESRTRP